MKLLALTTALLGTVALGIASSAPSTAPAAAPAPAAIPAPAPFHCQVPCGIYGDSMRIDMMREDAETIAKGMAQITEMEGKDSFPYNQMVRWIVTKDEHATKIQELVSSYWLAQRIKAPKDAGGRDKYLHQLELMHGITVAAMKCKQTTDTSNVDRLNALVTEFAGTYFTEEDLKHLEEHGKGH